MKLGLAIFIFLLGQCCIAQEIIPLRSDLAEVVPPLSKVEEGIIKITKVTHPRLHIYEPSSDKANGQSIIICPGGGYHILALDLEGSEIAEWLTGLGYRAYVLEYTVPSDRKAAFLDLQETIRKVKAMYPMTKVGVLGFSAGGHLAAAVSTSAKLSVKDKPDYTMLIYPAYLNDGENGGLSPELTLTSETKPMFLFITADDWGAQGSIVLASELQKNKTSVAFHMLPKGGHGYGLRDGEAGETWPLLLEKWLENQK